MPKVSDDPASELAAIGRAGSSTPAPRPARRRCHLHQWRQGGLRGRQRHRAQGTLRRRRGPGDRWRPGPLPHRCQLPGLRAGGTSGWPGVPAARPHLRGHAGGEARPAQRAPDPRGPGARARGGHRRGRRGRRHPGDLELLRPALGERCGTRSHHRQPGGPRRALRPRLRRGTERRARRSSPSRLIGVDIDDVRRVPLSIGVAAGSQKVAPISGVLRGGYLKTLVTDEPTAFSLLDAQTTPGQEGVSAMQTRQFGTIRHRCLRRRPWHVGHRRLDVGRRRRARLHRGHPGLHRRGRDAHRHGSRVRLRALRGGRRARPSPAAGTRSCCPRNAAWCGTPTVAGTSSTPRVTSSIATWAATRSAARSRPACADWAPTSSTSTSRTGRTPRRPSRRRWGRSRTLKAAGKIRAIAASNVTPADVAEYLEQGRPRRHPGALQRAGPRARGRAHPALPRAWRLDHVVLLAGAGHPLGQGGARARLRGRRPARARTRGSRRRTVPWWQRCCAELDPLCAELGVTTAQLVIAWTLARPGITYALCGARTPAHAVENATAGTLQLSADADRRRGRGLRRAPARPGLNAMRTAGATRIAAAAVAASAMTRAVAARRGARRLASRMSSSSAGASTEPACSASSRCRACSVTLVEKGDFCSGSSAAPSRMIHGGLRYLEYGETKLVRESLRERDALLRNAPHYVRPIETVMPLYSWFKGLGSAIPKFFRGKGRPSQRGVLVVMIGLTFYDLYTRASRMVPKRSFSSRAKTLRTLPGPRSAGRRIGHLLGRLDQLSRAARAGAHPGWRGGIGRGHRPELRLARGADGRRRRRRARRADRRRRPRCIRGSWSMPPAAGSTSPTRRWAPRPAASTASRAATWSSTTRTCWRPRRPNGLLRELGPAHLHRLPVAGQGAGGIDRGAHRGPGQRRSARPRRRATSSTRWRSSSPVGRWIRARSCRRSRRQAAAGG